MKAISQATIVKLVALAGNLLALVNGILPFFQRGALQKERRLQKPDEGR